MNRVLATTLSLAAAAGLWAAQGPRGGGRPASGLDMTNPLSVAGSVAAVSLGFGIEHPSIAVNGVWARVAPVQHLLDQGFELRAGDTVIVTEAPSPVSGRPDLYAVNIANAAAGLRIVLRDDGGVPAWAGGAPMAAGVAARSLKNATGGTLVLRRADGSPAW